MGILLEQKTLEYGVKGCCEHTLLHCAALYADLEMIALLQSGELSQIDTMAVDIDGYTALDAAIWRRDCNEKWSNFILKAPDEDPLEWFAAFEAILDGIVERQERFYHEANTEDEDQEIWEDASESADACLV